MKKKNGYYIIIAPATIEIVIEKAAPGGVRRAHMDKVKKILFPTDFSEASHYALSYAVEMKKLLNADLEIAHVLFDEANIISFYLPQMTMQNISHEFEDGAMKQFEEFTANAPELEGIKFTKKLLKGTPYNEIVKEAADGNFDMIIIGTHGRTGLEHVLFGSTAEKVVRKAPCPVLTVRPKGDVNELA